MPSVLLTGFEPFDGAAINESWEAVLVAQRLLATGPAPLEVAVRRLPVVFGVAADELVEAARVLQPDLVIAVGLAAGRRAVTPERVAVNLQDARIPDNAGVQPVDAPCVPEAPDGLFARLPVKAMAAAARRTGAPAEVSHSAGTFVCNDVMFRLAHAGLGGGFVHVPLGADLPVERSGAALAAMVRAALSVANDLDTPAGTIH